MVKQARAWLLRLLILIGISFSFVRSTGACGEEIPGDGADEYARGGRLEIPAEEFNLVDVFSKFDKTAWTPFVRGQPLYFKKNHVNVLRSVIPLNRKEDIVARFPNAHCNNHHAANKFYLIMNGQYKEIKPTAERVCAYEIPKDINVRDFFVVTKTSPVDGLVPIDWRLINRPEYVHTVMIEDRMIGIISGIVLIMCLYNIGLLALFKRLYLAYYLVYGFSYLVLFWGAFLVYDINPNVVAILYAVFPTFLILFSMEVLGIRRANSKLWYVGASLISIILLFYGIGRLGSEWIARYTLVFGVLCFLFSFFLAVRASYLGHKPAYAMVLGWSGIVLATVLMVLQLNVSGFPDMKWAFPVAVAFEIATFSFSMSQKLRLSELQFARENDHAFNQMKKMVYLHQLSQIRSGGELELTMPNSTAQACVLSFDIVGSSKIQHVNAKTFFRNTFARCYEVISDGYNGIDLKANAYRIKEMGDGFLCSIGYPFQAMTDNVAHDAVDLARKFAQILKEEAQMLHSETPICCGIGIALDSITGFYPEAGIKEYDLYGPALILATRYEGMRKIICPDAKQSVLIVHEKVYKSLDPSHRKGFIEVNLRERGIVVRDDSGANFLYYQFLGASLEKEESSPSHLRAV